MKLNFNIMSKGYWKSLILFGLLNLILVFGFINYINGHKLWGIFNHIVFIVALFILCNNYFKENKNEESKKLNFKFIKKRYKK